MEWDGVWMARSERRAFLCLSRPWAGVTPCVATRAERCGRRQGGRGRARHRGARRARGAPAAGRVAMPDYGDKGFWDARYADIPTGGKLDGLFDWYNDWDAIEPVVASEGMLESQELVTLSVGCGNSSLSEKMYDAGYRHVVGVDFSESVIEHMRARARRARPELKVPSATAHAPQRARGEAKGPCPALDMQALTHAPTPALRLQYEVMDVRELRFGDEAFDLIVDKGTLDSVVCGTDVKKAVSEYLTGLSRVLRSGGLLLVMSYGRPDDRQFYLEEDRYDWTVEAKTIPKPKLKNLQEGISEDFTAADYSPTGEDTHFIYIMRKRQAQD